VPRLLHRKLILVVLLASVPGALAQPRVEHWGQRQAAYDGRFTFVRIRWTRGSDGTGAARPNNNFWVHEFPGAEQNFTERIRETTRIDANADGSLNLTLDDPNVFKFPILFMWEPGYWVMTDSEAGHLRDYLLKGGFLVIHDFEFDQWDNFNGQLRRVLPGAAVMKIDAPNRIFDQFYRITDPDMVNARMHHLAGIRPEYFGVFEDNDPAKRLMIVVNYDTNLGEYWQMAGRGWLGVEPVTNAFELGTNYVVYGMTH